MGELYAFDVFSSIYYAESLWETQGEPVRIDHIFEWYGTGNWTEGS